MNVWKLKLYLITEELFQFSLSTYLILLLIETVQQGFVSYFFNFHILLYVIVLNGLVMVITQDTKVKTVPKVKKLHTVHIILLMIGGGLLVYYKMIFPNLYAIFISVGTAFLILFLTLIPSNKEK